ncbi:tetratricopeptide repeat protein [Nocardia sp. CA-119907]|uniref:tetratricopeptide repeat protein n=1 Tax=Nocardia sp. CA-119907 TaxID=3239973 RepID=UPI003D992AD0
MRVLGADHPDTLHSRHGLALAFEATGQVAEAITLHEQNLTDRQRLLGPEHPDTLTSRDKLAQLRDLRLNDQ